MGSMAGNRYGIAVVALCAALISDGTTPAQAQSKRRSRAKAAAPAWYEGELSTALQLARERNVPMVICCVLEEEEANERFKDVLRDDKQLGVLNEDTILLLVNNGKHGRRKVKGIGPDGKRVTKEVCEAFHTESCELHRKNWDAVYLQFVANVDNGEWSLPEAIVVGPDGKVTQRLADGEPPSTSAIVSAVQETRGKCGPGILASDLAVVRLRSDKGLSAGKARLWPDSWRAWSEVARLAPSGPFAERAREGLAAAEQGMNELFDKALAELTAGGFEQGYRTLQKLGFEGSPLERQVLSKLKQVARDPALKERVKALKLELEAEQLLSKATAALDGGDPKAAGRLLRKLAGKRFATTRTAATARERYPDLMGN